MPKLQTTDHGLILHYAGAHHLFPVARKDVPEAIRLAGHDGVSPDEVRIGWPAFFGPFVHEGMVFSYDEADGQPVRAGPTA